MTTKNYLMTLNPTHGLPPKICKDYPPLSSGKIFSHSQLESLSYNQNHVTKISLLSRLLWIGNYGLVCPAKQKNKTKIYVTLSTSFHLLLDRFTMRFDLYTLQDQMRIMEKHMTPGHTWNRQYSTPEHWSLMHYH